MNKLPRAWLTEAKNPRIALKWRGRLIVGLGLSLRCGGEPATTRLVNTSEIGTSLRRVVEQVVRVCILESQDSGASGAGRFRGQA